MVMSELKLISLQKLKCNWGSSLPAMKIYLWCLVKRWGQFCYWAEFLPALENGGISVKIGVCQRLSE